MNESYLKACEENNYSLVRDLLSRGADVNWKSDDNDLSGLYWAAFHNNGELLELLLSQTGVDVNIRSCTTTPLMTACRHGHENIVRRLCQVPGIELNARSKIGRTALRLAVEFDHPSCISVLTEVPGIDWNIGDNLGWNPLTLAIELGYPECLQTILSVSEAHLDLSVTDPYGRNITEIAVDSNKQRCVEILSEDRRVDWNIKNTKDWNHSDYIMMYWGNVTPVMACLKNNKIEMARCLINTPGVDLDTVDEYGKYLEDIARH